jgi:hypothetical protein
MAAAAWGMDNFNEYLKGSRFTLYRDLTTETTLGTTQLKTLNRLRNTMIDHDFEIQDRQKADLPDFLKKRQTEEGPENPGQNLAFNKVIHVDLINANLHHNEASDQTILSITDDTRTFNQVAVLANDKIDSMAAAIWHHWCQPYGPPEMILSNFQGPAKSEINHGRLSDAHQNLDDVEDFMEDDTDFGEGKLEALGREKNLKRKKSAYVGTNYKDEPTLDAEQIK